MVSAVSPWRRALQRDTCFPDSVFGPVLRSALRRLAWICRYEVIESHPPSWLRCLILTWLDRWCLARDASLAKGREPRRSDRCQSSSTTRLLHRTDASRDGVRDRGEP